MKTEKNQKEVNKNTDGKWRNAKLIEKKLTNY